MIGYSKTLSRILKEAGWEIARHPSGSHAVWCSPNKAKKVPIPQRIHDRNLAKTILREAGLSPRLIG